MATEEKFELEGYFLKNLTDINGMESLNRPTLGKLGLHSSLFFDT